MTAGKKAAKLGLNILFLVLCIVVAYSLSNYLFTSIPIIGDSMEPTIHDDDMVILYKPGKYNVGDVVVFDTEMTHEHMDKRLIKRIIGLPGDTIEISKDVSDGKYYVYRNGEKLEESYINSNSPMSGETASQIVPQGKFFFLGDNRGVSLDSRTGLLGDLDSIIGRVVLRYQPDDGKFDLTAIKRGK